MKIVVLDGRSTNPGDLSWEPLEKLGEVVVYDVDNHAETIERAKDADVVVLCRAPFEESDFDGCPNLKLIATLAIGYNTIDIKAANSRGVTVCNVPFYCVDAVAQMTFALLLELCNNVDKYSSMVKSGNWSNAADQVYSTLPFVELSNKTLGIIGFGNIAEAVSRIALAMHMHVMVYSRTKRALPEGCEWCDNADVVFQESDAVSLHVPLTDETRGMVGKGYLEMMKPSSFLINTSRGAVINEQDLADALNCGLIAGAGLDVMVDEPPMADNPLLSAKNCVITPHIAWASKDSRARLIETVAENINAYISGKPQNVVNSPN